MIERTEHEPIATERVVTPRATPEDASTDLTLRPQRLADYIGQEAIKQNLNIFMQAAKQRNEPLEHLLLYGPPGLGKTTLANVIAREMNVNIKITSGPAIERAGDLGSILTNLQEHDILFIDEIHRLSRTVEEALYPAMEDYSLDLMIGKGTGARSMRLELPKFTLVGATTRVGMLSSPLRDRFGSTFRLDFYSQDAIEQIIRRSAQILSTDITPEACAKIAACARKTPRTANRLLKRVRDVAQVRGNGTITLPLAEEALRLLGIDELGLDETDRRILAAIIDKFDGGPCGLNAIAASTSEERQTIEDVYEPFLLQLGFLARTRQGRVATRHAYAHLGKPFSAQQAQKTLL